MKKGKHFDLNNYLGICLQALITIYVSPIISLRLLEILKEHGIEEQLGCHIEREFTPVQTYVQSCTECPQTLTGTNSNAQH
jgi:hypothetical protein